MTKCKYCGSERTIKYGRSHGKQIYQCKDCNHNFTDNGNLAKMRTGTKAIVTALDLYYEGLSLRKVQRQLLKLFGVRISQVSVWEWIMKYGMLIKEYTDTLKAHNLSGEFHADETVIKSKGIDKWFWEMVDRETKFMVASHISEERTSEDATILFEQARKKNIARPKEITVDGLFAYRRGFNRVFYSRYKTDRIDFIQHADAYHNPQVERLHGTLKDRTRVMRGVGKRIETVRNLVAGWDAYYNFIRPHQSLSGRTPAQVAGVNIQPLEDGWESLILLATYHKNTTQSLDEFFTPPIIT